MPTLVKNSMQSSWPFGQWSRILDWMGKTIVGALVLKRPRHPRWKPRNGLHQGRRLGKILEALGAGVAPAVQRVSILWWDRCRGLWLATGAGSGLPLPVGASITLSCPAIIYHGDGSHETFTKPTEAISSGKRVGPGGVA